MVKSPAIHIDDTKNEAAIHLAQWLSAETARNISDHSQSVWALSGGTTPIALYELLANSPATIPWPSVTLFLADERDVYPSDTLSNFGMIQATLLSHLPLAPRRIYPWHTTGDFRVALADYRRGLAQLPQSDTMPQLDIALLGIGEDGHTASVFPSSPQERADDWVAYGPGPNVPRFTITLPVLARARHVIFFVSGHAKSAIVRECLTTPQSPLPAAWVTHHAHSAHWFLDRESARGL